MNLQLIPKNNLMEVRFYHLSVKPAEYALPEIVYKALSRDHKILVRVNSESFGEKISNMLWTFRPDSFLPHGNEKDGNPEYQPVWITSKTENPNNSDVLLVIGSADDSDYKNYDLCCYFFEDSSEQDKQQARQRWITTKEAGNEVTYWQQSENGWNKL